VQAGDVRVRPARHLLEDGPVVDAVRAFRSAVELVGEVDLDEVGIGEHRRVIAFVSADLVAAFEGDGAVPALGVHGGDAHDVAGGGQAQLTFRRQAGLG
jgi:hypothetical protein